MDYDKIISSAYNWFSIDKLVWFLLYFWIALPVLLFVPMGIEQNLFFENKMWLVYSLYVILYISFVIGILTLMYYSLYKKNFNLSEFTITKFVDVILLSIAQFWYIFVWNIHKSYRFTQLLLLFGLPLLYFYSLFLVNWFIDFSLSLFFIAYLIIVIYNFLRLSFSISIFISHDISIKDSIKKSWHITHARVKSILFAYLIIIAVVFVLLVFYTLIIGAIINLILLNYFVANIAFDLSATFAFLIVIAPVLVSYHFAYFELFSQLISSHKDNLRIKNILAKKVLDEEVEEFFEEKENTKFKKKTKNKKSKKSVKKKKNKVIKNKVSKKKRN